MVTNVVLNNLLVSLAYELLIDKLVFMRWNITYVFCCLYMHDAYIYFN
jgi:hypothetical protein